MPDIRAALLLHAVLPRLGCGACARSADGPIARQARGLETALACSCASLQQNVAAADHDMFVLALIESMQLLNPERFNCAITQLL